MSAQPLPYALEVSPDSSLQFTITRDPSADGGEGASRCGVMTLRHTGLISQYLAFKVKTTQPLRYLVRPNQGIVAPGSSETVSILLVDKDRQVLWSTYDRLGQSALDHSGDKFLVQSCAVSYEFSAQFRNEPRGDRGQYKEELVEALTGMWNSESGSNVSVFDKKLAVRHVVDTGASAAAPTAAGTASLPARLQVGHVAPPILPLSGGSEQPTTSDDVLHSIVEESQSGAGMPMGTAKSDKDGTSSTSKNINNNPSHVGRDVATFGYDDCGQLSCGKEVAMVANAGATASNPAEASGTGAGDAPTQNYLFHCSLTKRRYSVHHGVGQRKRNHVLRFGLFQRHLRVLHLLPSTAVETKYQGISTCSPQPLNWTIDPTELPASERQRQIQTHIDPTWYLRYSEANEEPEANEDPEERCVSWANGDRLSKVGFVFNFWILPANDVYAKIGAFDGYMPKSQKELESLQEVHQRGMELGIIENDKYHGIRLGQSLLWSDLIREAKQRLHNTDRDSYDLVHFARDYLKRLRLQMVESVRSSFKTRSEEEKCERLSKTCTGRLSAREQFIFLLSRECGKGLSAFAKDYNLAAPTEWQSNALMLKLKKVAFLRRLEEYDMAVEDLYQVADDFQSFLAIQLDTIVEEDDDVVEPPLFTRRVTESVGETLPLPAMPPQGLELQMPGGGVGESGAVESAGNGSANKATGGSGLSFGGTTSPLPTSSLPAHWHGGIRVRHCACGARGISGDRPPAGPPALNDESEPANQPSPVAEAAKPTAAEQKPLSSLQTKSDSDESSDLDEEENQRQRKAIPEWSQKANLHRALERQLAAGPDRSLDKSLGNATARQLGTDGVVDFQLSDDSPGMAKAARGTPLSTPRDHCTAHGANLSASVTASASEPAGSGAKPVETTAATPAAQSHLARLITPGAAEGESGAVESAGKGSANKATGGSTTGYYNGQQFSFGSSPPSSASKSAGKASIGTGGFSFGTAPAVPAALASTAGRLFLPALNNESEPANQPSQVAESAKPTADKQTYEMSDSKPESDSDEKKNQRPRKSIPEWSQKANGGGTASGPPIKGAGGFLSDELGVGGVQKALVPAPAAAAARNKRKTSEEKSSLRPDAVPFRKRARLSTSQPFRISHEQPDLAADDALQPLADRCADHNSNSATLADAQRPPSLLVLGENKENHQPPTSAKGVHGLTASSTPEKACNTAAKQVSKEPEKLCDVATAPRAPAEKGLLSPGINKTPLIHLSAAADRAPAGAKESDDEIFFEDGGGFDLPEQPPTPFSLDDKRSDDSLDSLNDVNAEPVNNASAKVGGYKSPQEKNAKPTSSGMRSNKKPQTTQQIVRRSSRRRTPTHKCPADSPGKFAMSPDAMELLQKIHVTHEGAHDSSTVDFERWDFSHFHSSVSTILDKRPGFDVFVYAGIEAFSGDDGKECEAPYVVGIVVPGGHTPTRFVAQYNGSETTRRPFADVGYSWVEASSKEWGGRVHSLACDIGEDMVHQELHRHSDVYSLTPADIERGKDGKLRVDRLSYNLQTNVGEVESKLVTWMANEETINAHIQNTVSRYFPEDAQNGKKRVKGALLPAIESYRLEKQRGIYSFFEESRSDEEAFKLFELFKILPINLPGEMSGKLSNKMYDAVGVDVVVCDHHSLTIPKLIDVNYADQDAHSLDTPALKTVAPQSLERFLNEGDRTLAPVAETLGSIVVVDLLVRTGRIDINCDQIIETFGVHRILQHFGLNLSDLQCDEGTVREYLSSLEKKLGSVFAQKTGRPLRPASALDFIISFPLFKSPPSDRPAFDCNNAGFFLGFDRGSEMLTISLFGDLTGDGIPIMRPISPAEVIENFVLKEELTELILSLLSQPKRDSITIPAGARDDDPAAGNEDTDCFKKALLSLPEDYLSPLAKEIVRAKFPDCRTFPTERSDIIRNYVKTITLMRVKAGATGDNIHETATTGNEVMIAEVTSGRYTHAIVIDGRVHIDKVIDPALADQGMPSSFDRTPPLIRNRLGVGAGEHFAALYIVKKQNINPRKLAKLSQKVLGKPAPVEDISQKEQSDGEPAAEVKTLQKKQEESGNDDPKTWTKSKKKRMKRKLKKQQATAQAAKADEDKANTKSAANSA